MELSAYRLAKEIGVPLTRITASLNGKRSISADTGPRLDRYSELSEGYWSGLQQDFDLRAAKRELGAALDRIRPYAPMHVWTLPGFGGPGYTRPTLHGHLRTTDLRSSPAQRTSSQSARSTLPLGHAGISLRA